jgi:hypothetical protein
VKARYWKLYFLQNAIPKTAFHCLDPTAFGPPVQDGTRRDADAIPHGEAMP